MIYTCKCWTFLLLLILFTIKIYNQTKLFKCMSLHKKLPRGVTRITGYGCSTRVYLAISIVSLERGDNYSFLPGNAGTSNWHKTFVSSYSFPIVQNSVKTSNGIIYVLNIMFVHFSYTVSRILGQNSSCDLYISNSWHAWCIQKILSPILACVSWTSVSLMYSQQSSSR